MVQSTCKAFKAMRKAIGAATSDAPRMRQRVSSKRNFMMMGVLGVLFGCSAFCAAITTLGDVVAAVTCGGTFSD